MENRLVVANSGLNWRDLLLVNGGDWGMWLFPNSLFTNDTENASSRSEDGCGLGKNFQQSLQLRSCRTTRFICTKE
jgi:hypothetical protein